jgi:hypothetical protein
MSHHGRLLSDIDPAMWAAVDRSESGRRDEWHRPLK